MKNIIDHQKKQARSPEAMAYTRLQQHFRNTAALKQQLAPLLPQNLQEHYQVVNYQDGILYLATTSNIIASRLRMLMPMLRQRINGVNVRQVRIQICPPNTATITQPTLPKLPDSARQILQQTAKRLAHHPQLAARLIALSQVNRIKEDPLQALP